MPRFTTLPRLGTALAWTAAATATFWTASSQAQVGSGPVRPPTTAMGVQAQATTMQVDPLLAQLDLAIEVSSRRYLTANTHSPWQIFHGLLALKRDFQLNVNGKKMSAIDWIATSEPQFDNQPLLLKTAHGGKFHSFTRPYAFEGHPAQFLALMSQSDLPVGFQFKVGTGSITVGDIINNTMKEVNTREECTWVLWGLQHYLPPTAQWVNEHNEPWSIERLVQIETAAPVVGAPCGGNHRLFALTRTRDKHLKNGGQLVGVWAQADYKISQHIEIARSLQNSDGSFSAEFYKTSGYTNDLNKRFNTTGHTMEFLSIALPEKRLNETWVRNAVMTLCNELVANRQRQIDCGPLYHTLNSLMIYRERIRGNNPTMMPVPSTETASSSIPALSTLPSLPKTTTPTRTATTAETLNSGEPTRLEAKQISRDATQGTPKITESVAPAPIPTRSAVRSEQSLNDLKIDRETRELLESLLVPGKTPSQVVDDCGAKPMNAGQPLLKAVDDPVSALEPQNR